MVADQLVSCLCVTRHRVALLRRAVYCFRNQTWPQRELMVLFEADDAATREYLATLNDPTIRAVEVPVTPKLPLGSLRNLSIDASRGHYIAQWDDDDWYSPSRLARQIGAIRSSNRAGCVLLRWTMFDDITKSAFLSQQRCWEGSLVAERTAMPRYALLARGEDTPLINRMLKEQKLIALDRPDLYIYVHHGQNTWDRTHWEKNLKPYAQPLSREQSEQVRQRLESYTAT